MKAILLNGPPGSGKDSVGDMLGGLLQTDTLKFAQPIIEYMQDTFGVSCDDGQDKDEPCPELHGLSRRLVAIRYSEDWIKPNFGIEWFGRQAYGALIANFHPQSIAIFTDSGFLEEAAYLSDLLLSENIIQVCMHRPGCDFLGDSRGYWHHPRINRIDFHNTCEDLAELMDKVELVLVPKLSEELNL